MTCDVCKRDNGETFVHSLSTGPMSIASCRECLEHTAEPEFAFHYLYDFVSTKGEGLAKWVNDLQTFKDGKYWTWGEWAEWRKPRKDLDELAEKQMKEMDSYNG